MLYFTTVHPSGGSTLWLGASDSDEEEVWTWSTGDLVMWQGFNGNIPNNRSRNSLVLDRASSAWKDAIETEKHGFVCEAEPGMLLSK